MYHTPEVSPGEGGYKGYKHKKACRGFFSI